MSKTKTNVAESGVPAQASLSAVKAKAKATWEDGDYADFARYMEPGAIEVLDSWNITAGTDLLDVACGSGQTAIPAARQGVHVTGVDIADNLIEYARKRARAEGLNALFDVGDAEDLPYPEKSFDNVITMFGAMFAPRPEQTAAELARVLRPGGKLIMANWTSSSMPAQMFKCVSEYAPPPPGFIPPVLWGDEKTATERLTPYFKDLKLTRRLYPQWHYPFPAPDLVKLFRTHFGPVKRAFDVSESAERKTLRSRLEKIYTDNSHYDRETLTITNGEFLEVVATRR